MTSLGSDAARKNRVDDGGQLAQGIANSPAGACARLRHTHNTCVHGLTRWGSIRALGRAATPGALRERRVPHRLRCWVGIGRGRKDGTGPHLGEKDLTPVFLAKGKNGGGTGHLLQGKRSRHGPSPQERGLTPIRPKFLVLREIRNEPSAINQRLRQKAKSRELAGRSPRTKILSPMAVEGKTMRFCSARFCRHGSAEPDIDPRLLHDAQAYLECPVRSGQMAASLRKAWQCFYQTYDPLIRRFARSCGLSADEIDDCAQEVWATLLTKLHDFRYQAASRGQGNVIEDILRATSAMPRGRGRKRGRAGKGGGTRWNYRAIGSC